MRRTRARRNYRPGKIDIDKADKSLLARILDRSLADNRRLYIRARPFPIASHRQNPGIVPNLNDAHSRNLRNDACQCSAKNTLIHNFRVRLHRCLWHRHCTCSEFALPTRFSLFFSAPTFDLLIIVILQMSLYYNIMSLLALNRECNVREIGICRLIRVRGGFYGFARRRIFGIDAPRGGRSRIQRSWGIDIYFRHSALSDARETLVSSAN